MSGILRAYVCVLVFLFSVGCVQCIHTDSGVDTDTRAHTHTMSDDEVRWCPTVIRWY